jgi:hypothetical protein
MTARERGQTGESDSTTPQRFAETPPQPAYPGSDYSFTLQAVMEMQKSVGQLTQAVQTLTEESKQQRAKLDRISHIIYAAGAVITVVGGMIVFLVNKLADALIAGYKPH